MHAQFVIVPPLEKVKLMFQYITGKELVSEVCWGNWKYPTAEMYNMIRQYYRPCHSQILQETEEKVQKTSCALLRQLVRPHGYRIVTNGKNTWKLVNTADESPKGIIVRSGKTVVWNEDSSPL